MNAGQAVRRRNQDLSQAEIFDLLSNERRRGVIHHLKRNGSMSLEELVGAIESWESDTTHASVYSGLVQTHLPRLVDSGVIEFDHDERMVRPTERLDSVTVYLEYSPGNDIPWAEYYLGFGAVSVALITVVGLEITPFDGVEPIWLAAGISAILLSSAVVHVAETRRGRLGTKAVESARERV